MTYMIRFLSFLAIISLTACGGGGGTATGGGGENGDNSGEITVKECENDQTLLAKVMKDYFTGNFNGLIWTNGINAKRESWACHFNNARGFLQPCTNNCPGGSFSWSGNINSGTADEGAECNSDSNVFLTVTFSPYVETKHDIAGSCYQTVHIPNGTVTIYGKFEQNVIARYLGGNPVLNYPGYPAIDGTFDIPYGDGTNGSALISLARH